MSYDIEIGVKIADTDIIACIATPNYDSPTYNIGKMLRKCTKWDFEQRKWYRVEEVISNIEHGINELKFNEKSYTKYNAPNGWGTTNTALYSLESLYICIEQCSNGWLFDIPIENLWVRW